MENEEESGRRGAAPAPVGDRLEVVDAMRGFALLGILLVNIEFMRGPGLHALLAGVEPALTGAEEAARFAIGWLVQGKFVSSFAILFGLGAAIMAERAEARGASPRPLLAKRYAYLATFGILHFALLFAGDILFIYGLSGLVLLALIRVRAKTALYWSIGLAVLPALPAVMSLLAVALPAESGDAPADLEAFFLEKKEMVVRAYTEGGFVDGLSARLYEALLIQGYQLLLLPWMLAMFALGVSIWKSGLLREPERRRRALRWAAALALPIGLAANFPLGFFGPYGNVTTGAEEVPWYAILEAPARYLGAPILGLGYLAAVGLIAERSDGRARLRALGDLGRVALSGYILQSVFGTALFVWLGYYGQLSFLQALALVPPAWIALLALAHIWARTGRRGPLEALWRRLTYGRG